MPAGGAGGGDLPGRALALNVAVQLLEAVRVDFHAHAQQLAAQVLPATAQHGHGHCPLPPLAQGVAEPQQPPELAAVAAGDGLDVQRRANPLVERHGRSVALAGPLAVPVDPGAQLLAGAGGHGVVVDAKGGALDIRRGGFAYQL